MIHYLWTCLPGPQWFLGESLTHTVLSSSYCSALSSLSVFTGAVLGTEGLWGPQSPSEEAKCPLGCAPTYLASQLLLTLYYVYQVDGTKSWSAVSQQFMLCDALRVFCISSFHVHKRGCAHSTCPPPSKKEGGGAPPHHSGEGGEAGCLLDLLGEQTIGLTLT